MLTFLASVKGDFRQRIFSATGLSFDEFNDEVFKKDSSKIVQLSIHNNCPQSCSHCFQLESTPRNKIDIERINKILAQYDPEVTHKIPFPREPLLLPDLLPIYKDVECADISTTSLLLRKRPEIIQDLKANGITTIYVSLHGNKEKHSELTNSDPKNYDEILAGIRLLVNAGIKVEIVTTLYKHNIDALDTLPQELINLGVSRWWIQRIMPIGRALSWRSSDFLIGDECNEVMARYAHLRLKYKPDKLHIGLDLSWGPNFYSSRLLRYLCGQEVRWPWIRYICPAVSGNNHVISYETGKIYPCIFFETFPETQMGQLEDPVITPKLAEQNLIDNLQGQCKECFYKNYCLGGCRAIAFSFAKYLHSTEPLFAGQDYCLTRALDKELEQNY